MVQFIATKGGIGIEIWGTHDELDNIYSFIGQFWNDEKYSSIIGFQNRDKIVSSFAYEIRKAKEGRRLKRKFKNQEFFGTKISWVHILFALTALKFNMQYFEMSKFEIAQILLIEFEIEKAMNAYDEKGAKDLVGFIEGGLYGANPHIYQYMRSINLDFFLLGGGKTSFRKLPFLLRKGVFYTDEYKEYEGILKADSKRLKCAISELELNDDHFDYESIKW